MYSFHISLLRVTFSWYLLRLFIATPTFTISEKYLYFHTVSFVIQCSQLQYYELQSIIWVFIVLRPLSFDYLWMPLDGIGLREREVGERAERESKLTEGRKGGTDRQKESTQI